MLKRLLIIIVTVLALPSAVNAQWDAQFSDYTTLKSLYNPAVSGTNGMLDVAAAYSMQMVGYDDAPKTMYLGANLPIYFLGPRHGAGVSLMNDEIGIFKTQRINLQYAVNMKLGKRSRLAVGVQGSMISEEIDPSDLKLSDTNDPAFPTATVNGSGFDFAAGLYFYNPKYWAGLSVQHANAPVLEVGDMYEVSMSQIYYLMGGCNIKIKNTLLSLQPSFLVQTDLQSWREDVQCKLTYEYENRKMFFGVGYSPKTSVTAMVGGNFHGVQLGYSYQMYTEGIGLENGSHEITLSYQTNLDLFKKGRNKHKSVRFL